MLLKNDLVAMTALVSDKNKEIERWKDLCN